MRRLAAAATAALLAACGGSGVASLPSAGHASASWMDPTVRTTHNALLYVADLFEADVRVYMEAGHHQHPVGRITSGIGLAGGLFVDTKRDLWVANQTGYVYQSEILRYPQGSTTPDLTLLDTNGAPSELWVARDGTVYAVSSPIYGPSVIVKYPPDSQQYQVIADPNMEVLTSVVGDAKGNIYAGGLPYGALGEVDVLPAGQSTWQNTGMITNAPAALAFDAKGDLLVSNDAFLTFRIGRKHPSNRIACRKSDCEQVAFDRSGRHLWAIEAADFTGNVYEFEYPSGKQIDRLRQPPGSEPNGIALSPALYP